MSSQNVLGGSNPFANSGITLTSGANGTTTTITPTIQQSSNVSSSNCIICPSTSIVFLQALTTKLIDMTTALKRQFANLEAQGRQGTTRGTVLASTSVKGNVRFKPEFAIYVQRYGPPILGVFDPLYLDLIRAELDAGILM
jgi:hypothetical protein